MEPLNHKCKQKPIALGIPLGTGCKVLPQALISLRICVCWVNAALVYGVAWIYGSL